MHPYEELQHLSSLFRQCRNDHATILSLVGKIKNKAICALNVGDNLTGSDIDNIYWGIRDGTGNYTDNQKTAFWLLWNCNRAIMQGGDIDVQTSIEIVRLYGELYYESYRGTKNGKALRPNALSKLIDEIVMANPNISEVQLLKELKEYEKISVIDEINGEEIIYHDENEVLKKPVPISGLKDRLGSVDISSQPNQC